MFKRRLPFFAFSLMVMLFSCSSSDLHPKKLTHKEIERFSRKDAIRWGASFDVPERTLLLMTQADCIHCQRLEKQLQLIPDVTVYAFFLTGSSEHAKEVGKKAWCFHQNMKNRHCDVSALDRNHERARQLGITATPAIIFPDGTLHTGWMSAASIKKHLSFQKMPYE